MDSFLSGDLSVPLDEMGNKIRFESDLDEEVEFESLSEKEFLRSSPPLEKQIQIVVVDFMRQKGTSFSIPGMSL